ncbi:MAG: ABC transporter ATP-binding protein [Hyphomonadaceae bacterium]
MAKLAARDLTVRRGGRAILDRVSFDLPEAGFVVVIGPNGAGKSTLLATLAGLIAADEGAVLLGNISLAAFTPRALALRRAYLPQNARCEWPISTARLVALGLTPSLPAFGGFSAQDEARIAAALEACDLTAFRDRAATTLSGGELARAMLARAIVADPEILIADEPIAGLDPRHALDAMARLKARGAARLVIAAAHDLALAALFADHAIALREGRILAQGDDVFRSETLSALFDARLEIRREGEGVSLRYL